MSPIMHSQEQATKLWADHLQVLKTSTTEMEFHLGGGDIATISHITDDSTKISSLECLQIGSTMYQTRARENDAQSKYATCKFILAKFKCILATFSLVYSIFRPV